MVCQQFTIQNNSAEKVVTSLNNIYPLIAPQKIKGHSRSDPEEAEEQEMSFHNERRRTVVLGVTKNKKSKLSKKLAITFRY